MKKFISLIQLLALLLGLLMLPACSEETDPNAPPDLSDPVKIVIEISDFGAIEAELYPHVAPITVEHITALIEDGFYNNLTFHRIIDGFMIQGGDPTGTGYGDPSQEKIKGEFTDNGVVNNLPNDRGVLAMARSNDNNSATSQFFINLVHNKHLDGSYTTFGKVTSGMEVVDAIAKVAVGANDLPLTPVVINSITIVE